MNQEQKKQAVAEAAIKYIPEGSVVGVGSGTTANLFVDALAKIKHTIEGAVASSEVTAERIKANGIPLLDLNTVDKVPVYVDGADEANRFLQLMKGGGGALTREKIIAAVAEKFICVIDDSKKVSALGRFPLPVEVIPMARSYVARQLVKLGGDPVYRQGFTTDNGNIILDIHNLEIQEPMKLEQQINNITGVVTNGLFAVRPADIVLMGTDTGIEIFN